MKFRVDSLEEAQRRAEQALSRIDDLENSSTEPAARAVSGETSFYYDKKVGDSIYEVCITISARGAES